jgi:hypothetical protein
MIKSDLTDLYLQEFDSLTEALYLCWYNSFCFEKNELNKVELEKQIHTYGIYNCETIANNELPLSYRNKLHFKTLKWVNKYADLISENVFYESIERNKLVIKEIEYNLFKLTDKTSKNAYAKVILSDIDRSRIHNHKVTDCIIESKLKEFFEQVLNQNFISEVKKQNNIHSCHPCYDITVKLIGHFEFIDKLIELFKFFEIDLLALAEEFRFNLFIFKKKKLPLALPSDLENNILPKFNSPLSDDCLIKIMQFLFQKKKLNNPNVDTWLYWFNRKYINIPEPMSWTGSNTLLSNIIQQLCGNCISNTIKTAFGTEVFVKPTWKIYQSSNMYKEIERIITISKQKNV